MGRESGKSARTIQCTKWNGQREQPEWSSPSCWSSGSTIRRAWESIFECIQAGFYNARALQWRSVCKDGEPSVEKRTCLRLQENIFATLGCGDTSGGCQDTIWFRVSNAALDMCHVTKKNQGWSFATSIGVSTLGGDSGFQMLVSTRVVS